MMTIKNLKRILPLFLLLLIACKSSKSNQDKLVISVPTGPTFNADSAFVYCQAQCDFGPRTMNSTAHDKCEEWIIKKFQSFGCQTTTQKVVLKGYDGTALNSTNRLLHDEPPAHRGYAVCQQAARGPH